MCREIRKHFRKTPKVYMGIGSPALIKSQKNLCLRVVCLWKTLHLISGAKVNGSSCTEIPQWSRSPLWLRNIWFRDLKPKSHFNTQLHTYKSSLEGRSGGASAHVNLPSCMAVGIENLMHWKAVIPGVLDVIWMLPFALINSKKNKKK